MQGGHLFAEVLALQLRQEVDREESTDGLWHARLVASVAGVGLVEGRRQPPLVPQLAVGLGESPAAPQRAGEQTLPILRWQVGGAEATRGFQAVILQGIRSIGALPPLTVLAFERSLQRPAVAAQWRARLHEDGEHGGAGLAFALSMLHPALDLFHRRAPETRLIFRVGLGRVGEQSQRLAQDPSCRTHRTRWHPGRLWPDQSIIQVKFEPLPFAASTVPDPRPLQPAAHGALILTFFRVETNQGAHRRPRQGGHAVRRAGGLQDRGKGGAPMDRPGHVGGMPFGQRGVRLPGIGTPSQPFGRVLTTRHGGSRGEPFHHEKWQRTDRTDPDAPTVDQSDSTRSVQADAKRFAGSPDADAQSDGILGGGVVILPRF